MIAAARKSAPDPLVSVLRERGFVRLGRSAFWKDFVAHLDAKPQYPGHVKNKFRGIEEAHPPVTCHDMADVVGAPGFFRYALSLTDLAGEYLEMPTPRMYSLNAFRTRPAHRVHPGIQDWHRDYDDTRFVALFMYCTDVLSMEDGPHQFRRGSHDPRWKDEGDGDIETIYGPAGTMFLADTSGLHRGVMPSLGERVIAWCRWGVSPVPKSYINDRLSPVARDRVPDYPKDLRLQASVSLVAA